MECKVVICQQSVALKGSGKMCDWDDLTVAEREAWLQGQTAADEEWERRKNGVPAPTLEQQLIERDNYQLLFHC